MIYFNRNLYFVKSHFFLYIFFSVVFTGSHACDLSVLEEILISFFNIRCVPVKFVDILGGSCMVKGDAIN